MQLVLENGLGAVSVAEVAQRAGVHETSIYRRWGTKENLAVDALLGRVELAIPVPNTGSLRGDLLEVARNAAAFQRSPLGKALLQIGLQHDLPEYDAARKAFWQARQSAEGVVLEHAQSRGELRSDVDHRLVLETFVGVLVVRIFLVREATDDEVLEKIVDLTVRGIGAGP